MTHFARFTVVSISVAVAFILVSCPSPINNFTDNNSISDVDESPVYQTTAEVTFDAARGMVVFVEEDGTEIPVVVNVDGKEDGPVELIDYSILDDGGASVSRSSQTRNRIRAVVVGRRRDGRSGVWIIYRYGGVMVLPNEDGNQDSALMELVEFEGSPYLGEDWVYEATAIKDGKIIIGKLYRPDGWEYLGSDAPDPTIGVFWSICETEEKFYISRARPILMMHEPEPDAPLSRHSWYKEWLDRLMEWLQATFLELAWNYLGTADRFVPDAEVIEGGFEAPPEGSYVVEGVDKHGALAWAWITYKSVENIVDAPEVIVDPPENRAPWPVTGPTSMQVVTRNPDDPTKGTSFPLQVTDNSDPPVTYYAPDGPFDPDQDDVVTFEGIAVTVSPEISGYTPETVIVNGVFTLVWHDLYNSTQHQIIFQVKTSDGIDETLSEPIIKLLVVG